MIERNNVGDNGGKKNTAILLIIVGVIVIILIGYFFGVSKDKNNLDESIVTDSQDESSENLELSNTSPEVADVIKKVSKHMLLPGKVEITVTTVQNAEALKEKDLFVFQYVQNGYKVLFYNGGMIMYDPVLDKIVDAVRVPVIKQ